VIATTVVQRARVRTDTLPYMAQLDALRAFAVIAVIIHHYTRSGWGFGADSGVKLFFTLSGFLITGILLRGRASTQENDIGRLPALGRFYARRFLRIFPLYYFVIAVAFAINLQPARKVIGWLLTYTLNIHMANQGWFEANFAHFWSLSVEEQFYVFWPWLVLFFPQRWLLHGVLAMASVGPLYRFSYVWSGYHNMTGISSYISTLSCVDSLGLGALLAVLVHHRVLKPDTRWIRIVLPAAIATTAAMFWFANDDVYLIAYAPVQSVTFCCVIYAASLGIGGPVGQFLEWQPLRYLGKISYGLYVYHPLMPRLAGFILVKVTGINFPEYSLPVSAVAVVLTLVVASVSWRLIEKPINDLKHYFEYRPRLLKRAW